MAHTIALRTADADDVPRIVSLLNAAFAMERDFIDKDRTSPPEIERYMTTGTFFVVDGEAGGLAACMYLEQRGERLYLGMLAVNACTQGRGLGRQMMVGGGTPCRVARLPRHRHPHRQPPHRTAAVLSQLGFVDNGTEPWRSRCSQTRAFHPDDEPVGKQCRAGQVGRVGRVEDEARSGLVNSMKPSR